MSSTSRRSTHLTARTGRRVAAVGVLALIAAGCGSDGESASPEEQFCAAGESLQEDVSGLASVDLISGGLDALTEQFDAVDAVGEALGALRDDISAANATNVATAIGEVATAATGVVAVLTDTCS